MGEKKKRVAKPGKVLGRPKEWTDEELHKLGKELVEHMKLPGVYHLSSFCAEKMKSQHWLYDMAKYPIFSDYFACAKKILGNKMMRLSMEANPNNWVLKTYMPRYLDEQDFIYEDMKREMMVKLEAAKESGELEPDHPFWEKLMEYVGSPKMFNRRGDKNE